MTTAQSKPVVLKREPLGSLREEFIISGRKFVPGRKSCGWKNLNVILLFYSTHQKTAQRGWFWCECLQYKSTSCFIIIFWACSFITLLGRNRSWGCWAANRLSHHPEPSGHAIHEEVDSLDIGRQHGQQFDLLRHTPKPQKQPYCICVNRSRNICHLCGGGWARAVLGRPFQEGESGMKARSLVVLSKLSTFHQWSAQTVALLLLSDELMNCCTVGTNGCLNLSCRAFPLDGQVSAEWIRCPGSMGRCARDSVAPLPWSSGGLRPARIGRLSSVVGRRHPVTVCKASLMAGSMRRVWALRHQTGAQYSGVEWTWLFTTLLLQHPSQSQ